MLSRKIMSGLGPCALIASTLAGCSQPASHPHAPPEQKAEKVEAAPQFSEEEARQFAEAFVAAMKAKDASALGKLLNWDAMLDKATVGILAPAKEKERYIELMKGTADRTGVFARQLLEFMKAGASCKLLRHRRIDGRDRLLFRVLVPDGAALDYYEVLLDRDKQARIEGVDVFDLANGELLSQTARRAFLTAAVRWTESANASVQGAEREYLIHFAKVEAMNTLVQQGKYRDALALYDQLPPLLQGDKNVLLTRLRAAQNVGPAEFTEAVANFRTFHPGDPSVDLFSIVYFYQKKDYPKALEMIDRVDKALDGDPYLNVLRANVHLDAGDVPAARQAANKVIAEEPTLAEGYWALISIALHEKKFDEVLQLLGDIDQRFSPQFPDMNALPVFAGFVKSPQYQEWLRSRKSSR
jgi:tetratricopeptide (TPR) repeat protein